MATPQMLGRHGDGKLPTPRWFLPLLLVCWAVFTAWLVWGFPPPVDLPAHAAQFETLANLVRGDAEIGRYYEVRFPQGYGLDYWVFLPLALIRNGAVAARVDLWTTLQLYVLGELALLRAFRRSDYALLWGLPLAFNLSYWYGLLPGLLAQPFAFLAAACFVQAVDDNRRRWIVLLNVAAAATLLSHLVAFAALGVGLGALAVFRTATTLGSMRTRLRPLAQVAAGLGLPIVLAVPKVWAMAGRSVTPGPWAPTEYAALSHLNWFFRNYAPEGWLAAWCPLIITAALLATWVSTARASTGPERWMPAVLCGAWALLYVATPKTLSGIYLISVRLPVLAGVASLALVDASSVRRWMRWGMTGLCAVSLGETALFHARFKREVEGLETMITPERPPKHGYMSLAGRYVLGSRIVYLEHLGQWLTATRGGVGHDFFADAEHHPVRFKQGVEIPASLEGATVDQRGWFDEVLTFGDGPLPPGLDDMHLEAQAGHWRKWRRAAMTQ
jgi:hypothetical protein